MLLDIGRPEGTLFGTKLSLNSLLNRTVSIYSGYKFQLGATLYKSNLSVNLQNLQSQMINVANVRAGIEIYLVVGDIRFDNTMCLVIATPKK